MKPKDLVFYIDDRIDTATFIEGVTETLCQLGYTWDFDEVSPRSWR